MGPGPTPELRSGGEGAPEAMLDTPASARGARPLPHWVAYGLPGGALRKHGWTEGRTCWNVCGECLGQD